MATYPQITDIFPSSNALGISVADQVRVQFDQEMDTTSINIGTLVLSGPDGIPIFGPLDATPFDEPDFEDEDILSSPTVIGYVKGAITFIKVDGNGYTLDDSEVDYDGDGTLWQTVAIFTPDKPLEPNTEYKCTLLGDEPSEEEYQTGITTRTVFDTQSSSTADTGLYILGGYTGSNASSYIVEITGEGETGTATYIWYKESDPLVTYEGVTTTGTRKLAEGVYIICDPDAYFYEGDTFQAKVVPAVKMANTYSWTFTTGSSARIVPPSSYSASGIEELSEEGAGALRVLSITPKNLSCNLNPDTFNQIIIKFNKTINSSTITDDSVLLWSESVNGDSQFQAAGTIAKVLSVDDDTLTIQFG